MVCENEILSKNKFSDRDKDKDKDKTGTEDKNKTILKTKTILKAKTEDKDLLDKINNNISAINKLNEGLANVKADVTKKIELMYESMNELEDEIYSNDSWLRLVELDKTDVIIDEILNVIWKVLYESKSRIIPEMITIDKYKNIDGYVSELTDLINLKIELVNDMCEEIDNIMSEINNKTNMIDENLHKACEMDNDTLN